MKSLNQMDWMVSSNCIIIHQFTFHATALPTATTSTHRPFHYCVWPTCYINIIISALWFSVNHNSLLLAPYGPYLQTRSHGRLLVRVIGPTWKLKCTRYNCACNHFVREEAVHISSINNNNTVNPVGLHLPECGQHTLTTIVDHDMSQQQRLGPQTWGLVL